MLKNSSIKARNAFTLVELAIVIVIIGLLVGGVLQGQELINQAKLRTLMKSFEEYEAATIIFKDKYKFLPGDMPRAPTKLQGAYSGDGSGTVNLVATAATDGPTGSMIEAHFYWQNLSISKMIKGSFNGLYDPASGKIFDKGVNVPPVSGFSNSAMMLIYYPSTGATFNTPSLFGRMGHYFMLGAVEGLWPSLGFISATSAQQIDSKLDDGHAKTGIVNAVNGYTDAGVVQTGCVTNDIARINAMEALQFDYDLSKETPSCMMVKWANF
jgi:prepilin-type N-terminal cleavage/methylation domain-containing protein